MRFLKTVLSAACIAVATPASGDKVVVYSARIEQLIWPLFDAYTRDTGVTVKFVTDKEGPRMERLKAEGPNTPADVVHDDSSPTKAQVLHEAFRGAEILYNPQARQRRLRFVTGTQPSQPRGRRLHRHTSGDRSRGRIPQIKSPAVRQGLRKQSEDGFYFPGNMRRNTLSRSNSRCFSAAAT